MNKGLLLWYSWYLNAIYTDPNKQIIYKIYSISSGKTEKKKKMQTKKKETELFLKGFKKLCLDSQRMVLGFLSGSFSKPYVPHPFIKHHCISLGNEEKDVLIIRNNLLFHPPGWRSIIIKAVYGIGTEKYQLSRSWNTDENGKRTETSGFDIIYKR